MFLTFSKRFFSCSRNEPVAKGRKKERGERCEVNSHFGSSTPLEGWVAGQPSRATRSIQVSPLVKKEVMLMGRSWEGFVRCESGVNLKETERVFSSSLVDDSTYITLKILFFWRRGEGEGSEYHLSCLFLWMESELESRAQERQQPVLSYVKLSGKIWLSPFCTNLKR